MKFIVDYSQVTMSDILRVGGKNASIGEMIVNLSHLGIKVPRGFATTVEAYKEFLAENSLEKKIRNCLSKLKSDDINHLGKASLEIQQWMHGARLPKTIQAEIQQAYHDLKLSNQQSVAVRSSATAEDLPEASFAGQQETYLNVTTEQHVLHAIKQVYSSLFSERAISYRMHHGFKHDEVGISVGVQQMIRSDLASSGVVFTLDTESGFDQAIFITASYGLGEMIVKGEVTPDEFYVHKPNLRNKKDAIISRNLGQKTMKLVYNKADKNDSKSVQILKVPFEEQNQYCLTDEEILQLAKQALIIEEHYGKPMDIEWAKDGIDQQIYIVQARPETVQARNSHQIIEQYRLVEKIKPLISGRSVGQKIRHGVARLIESPKQKDNLGQGDILVTDMTDPDWEPIMKKAAAIVTNRGGRTCHAAIVARELGIPAVVGCMSATQVIKEGQEITVSCAEGETGFIYPEKLKYEVDKTEINNLPKLPIKLCLNLANPEQAFACQFLPNEGIGLARVEFIISNMIGIHPNALLNIKKLPKDLREEIKKKTSAYKSPVEFYIEKLAEGISAIAAAFYPKPIIVRFSDFKSNEYANLLGGQLYELKEENPMIGYRGASRYLSGNFKECFILECEAIKRVRNSKGLTNTHVMFPFVRTVAEAKQLITLLKSQGLKREKKGLQVYMMCEIPSNIILAEEFLQYFDGFSIGSNDLTQLTLGLDRDSELIADLFDERNEAVLALLEKVIKTCKKHNKYVGICGQGPSDHLDFAHWLAKMGIDSLSLSPDSIVKTWLALAKTCKK